MRAPMFPRFPGLPERPHDAGLAGGRGVADLSEDPADLVATATAIGTRYMGADRAEEFGRRNGVPGELVVRVRLVKVIADFDVTG